MLSEDSLRQSVEVLLFYSQKKESREIKKEEFTMDKKEYYIYVKGKALSVNEEVYKTYWKIIEHEKYLQKKDWKYGVIRKRQTMAR